MLVLCGLVRLEDGKNYHVKWKPSYCVPNSMYIKCIDKDLTDQTTSIFILIKQSFKFEKGRQTIESIMYKEIEIILI